MEIEKKNTLLKTYMSVCPNSISTCSIFEAFISPALLANKVSFKVLWIGNVYVPKPNKIGLSESFSEESRIKSFCFLLSNI